MRAQVTIKQTIFDVNEIAVLIEPNAKLSGEALRSYCQLSSSYQRHCNNPRVVVIACYREQEYEWAENNESQLIAANGPVACNCFVLAWDNDAWSGHSGTGEQCRKLMLPFKRPSISGSANDAAADEAFVIEHTLDAVQLSFRYPDPEEETLWSKTRIFFEKGIEKGEFLQLMELHAVLKKSFHSLQIIDEDAVRKTRSHGAKAASVWRCDTLFEHYDFEDESEYDSE